jgi:hypothetical protein
MLTKHKMMSLAAAFCAALSVTAPLADAAPTPASPRPTVAASDVSVYLEDDAGTRLIAAFHAVPEPIAVGESIFIADSTYRVCQVFSLELARGATTYVLSAHHALIVQHTTGPCRGVFPRGLRLR